MNILSNSYLISFRLIAIFILKRFQTKKMGNSNKKQSNQSSRITEQDKAILVSERF